VAAMVVEVGGLPIGYGEIWEDPDEHEAELARLIVDPVVRGRGIGRRMARLLLEEARRRGWAAVWLRVVPGNEPALAAYRAAGFERASPDEERSFNAGQPVSYRWLRPRPTGSSGRSGAAG